LNKKNPGRETVSLSFEIPANPFNKFTLWTESGRSAFTQFVFFIYLTMALKSQEEVEGLPLNYSTE
jgi:hypothetical protein